MTMPNWYTYESALEAAGATVHAFKQFGSYQGTLLALVTHPDGRRGWVKDYFGSCSGCDALESALSGGWRYDDDDERAAHERAGAVRVGTELLAGLTSADALLADFAKEAEWDMEADEMTAFVRLHEGRPDPDHDRGDDSGEEP